MLSAILGHPARDVQRRSYVSRFRSDGGRIGTAPGDADPHAHIHELDRLVRPGGAALLATPYDWSPAATPIEGWLGGHSQRGPHGGDPEPVLRGLFDPGRPQAAPGLHIVAEDPDVPWEVTLHRRSALRVHALALKKEP